MLWSNGDIVYLIIWKSVLEYTLHTCIYMYSIYGRELVSKTEIYVYMCTSCAMVQFTMQLGGYLYLVCVTIPSTLFVFLHG